MEGASLGEYLLAHERMLNTLTRPERCSEVPRAFCRLGQRCTALDHAPTDLRCAGDRPHIATSIAQYGAPTPAAPPLQVMRRPRVAEAVRRTRGPHGRHDPHPSCTVRRPAVRQPSMPPSTFMTWE